MKSECGCCVSFLENWDRLKCGCAHKYIFIRFSLLSSVRKEETERSFLDNGRILLEDLIASCDRKSNPICSYSAAELISATNNFDPSCIIAYYGGYQMFRAFLYDRPVIIKKYITEDWVHKDEARSCAIRDIIISLQMSTHKNSLKLLGCCLEFPLPALVLENATKGVLNGSLRGGNEDDQSLLLPWKTRLRIAKQMASALTYLHTAFSRSIIHWALSPICIYLDDDYVPKLSDFSLSITIPPEQLHVKDALTGTFGYIDPTYIATGFISEKGDVYSFGVLLLVLLTGQKATILNQAEAVEDPYLAEYVKLQFDGQFQAIVDPKILEEVGEGEQAQQQLHDFLALALLCIQDEIEARPYMIDVAKELVRIDKSILPALDG